MRHACATDNRRLQRERGQDGENEDGTGRADSMAGVKRIGSTRFTVVAASLAGTLPTILCMSSLSSISHAA
jgi:hypothetical protein